MTVTPEVSKYRVVAWLPAAIIADKNLSIVARADDTPLGLLHWRFHERWSLRMCPWMGKGSNPPYTLPYTPTTCFETFSFPAGLTPADTAHQRTDPLEDGALIPADLQPAVRARAEAIARAAKRLTDLRDAWLNSLESTERVREVVPLGMDRSPYPGRIVAKPASTRTSPSASSPTCTTSAQPGSRRRTKRWMPPSPLPTAGPTTRRR